MEERTATRISDSSDKGILHARVGREKFSLNRYLPSNELRPFIKRYWVVEWDLRDQPPYTQVLLSHPNVNWVIEQDQSRIYGINKMTTSHHLTGQGRVFGIKFQSAGFYPFFKKSVSMLTGRSIDAKELFQDADQFRNEILTLESEEQMVAGVEQFLRRHTPEMDEQVVFINRVVAAICEDRAVIKVDDLVERFDISKRYLQRLFHRYVGVSPKWVIQRYRLHEAAEQIEKGVASDWVALALALGYYDQSHFIRDFKATLGRSPEMYVKETGAVVNGRNSMQ